MIQVNRMAMRHELLRKLVRLTLAAAGGEVVIQRDGQDNDSLARSRLVF